MVLCMTENNAPKRIFILFSAVNDQTISTSLGTPEYSYYFVCKGFADVLRDLGEVRVVDDPANEVDPIYDEAQARGLTGLFFCFTPPNKMIRNLRCPTIVVFAWEFDTLPQASLGMKDKEDWVLALQEAGQAISLSSFSRDVVKRTLGDAFNISSIPVPIPVLEQTPPKNEKGRCIEMEGLVIDTANYVIGADGIEALSPVHAFPVPPWDGEPIELSFSRNADQPASLCGFYEPEVWGAWSCLPKAWILLPKMVSGDIVLDLKFMAYGGNIGKTIVVSLGKHRKQLKIDPDINIKRMCFSLSEPTNVLDFSDLDARAYTDRPDPRSMAIGLMSASLTRSDQKISDREVAPREPQRPSLSIDGILYSSVLTPKCGRKNWRDMITAFCWAFRETPDATLLIKVSAQHHSEYFSELHELFAQLQPFCCRMIFIHGFLSSADYQTLVSQTDFYVNTSRAEGQCLPLMEFMARGKPAIAPRHTSLLDYVNEDANFLVGSSEELTIWPHDPKEKYMAMRHRIDWSDLVSAFRDSYDVVTMQPERYKKMSDCAKKRIAAFASRDRVVDKLNSFIMQITRPQEIENHSINN
jgi:glycosyltransferase involved in cell wall biosynthesis